MDKGTKVFLQYDALYDRWFVRLKDRNGKLLGSGTTKELAKADAKFALERMERVKNSEDTAYI